MVTYKAVMSATAAFQRVTASLVAKGDGATPVGLASRDRIPTLHATDCNDPALVGLIAAVEPDFLISVNVYQRVDEPLLAAPRIAALNTHFGMLPNYRGMSPVVWALAHGEQEIGITVHRMVIRFDEGQVIAQESLPLEPHESVMSVTFRGADRASQMLSGSVVRLMKDPSAGIAQEGSGSYFSLPTKQTIRQLSARGHKLWRWKDLSQFWK